MSHTHKPCISLRPKAYLQAGITLTELMIAMAISSIIMLGISNIYFSTKSSYLVNDEFARLQENSRYALNLLSKDVRNAGYFGCASSGRSPTQSVKNYLNNPSQFPNNLSTGVMGFEAKGSDVNETIVTDPMVTGSTADWETSPEVVAYITGGGLVPANIVSFGTTGGAVKGSDIIVLRSTLGTGVQVLADNPPSANLRVKDLYGVQTGACPQNASIAGLDVNGYSNLCPGDTLLISDCENATIFQGTQFQAVGPGVCKDAAGNSQSCFNLVHDGRAITPGNATTVFADTFEPGSEVIKLVTKAYFIGIPAAGGEPALYVSTNGATPEPLLEGIENIQILYGVDTSSTPDGVADRYVSAQNVPDTDGDATTLFESVVSVKLSLLLRTPQDLPTIKRSTADHAALVYNMVSIAAPIKVDVIATVNHGSAKDRRMRKVVNLIINLRNRSMKF